MQKSKLIWKKAHDFFGCIFSYTIWFLKYQTKILPSFFLNILWSVVKLFKQDKGKLMTSKEYETNFRDTKRKECPLAYMFVWVTQTCNDFGLVWVTEEGWMMFSKGWQGCYEGFAEGEAQRKSKGKPCHSRLFYSYLHSIWSRFYSYF